MKKYIIAAAAALAIGMALSACAKEEEAIVPIICLLYTSPSPRDRG